jgi:outer membrane lipoprotein-sorting protein
LRKVISLLLISVIMLSCVGLAACGGEEEAATTPPANGGTPAPSNGETTAPPEKETPPSPTTEAGLVAYYPFDGDTEDYSENGNHAENYGATFVSGTKEQALKFDGADDYVIAPVDINPDTLPQMTMAAWVKADDGSPIRQVISHDSGGYDRSIGIDQRGGGTGWSTFSGSGGVLGFHPVEVGKWVFIAVVYDQNAGTVKLYVDGAVYEGEGTLESGYEYVNIGCSPAFREHFSGIIDEVKIYDYALSTDELESLHETGIAQPGATPTTGDGDETTGDGTTGDGTTGDATLGEILARGADVPPVKYDQVFTTPGNPTVTWKVWVEGRRSRVEMSAEGQTMIHLVDFDAMTMYMYNPAENVAIEMDLSGFEELATEVSEDILNYNPTIIGTETLDGKVCLVVAYTYTDSQGVEVKIKQWLWKEHGFPIRMETTREGQTSIMEMKNIEFGDIDDSMFELPDGVTIMEMPG